jgi:hypothetical protein
MSRLDDQELAAYDGEVPIPRSSELIDRPPHAILPPSDLGVVVTREHPAWADQRIAQSPA